jgi:ketosteroid isomerase-like protein
MPKILRIGLLLSFAFQIILPSGSIAQHKPAEEDLIQQLEYKWIHAEFAQDTAFIARILDQRFMAIEPDGIVNRQQEISDVFEAINEFKKNGRTIDSFALKDMAINLYDNTAVVTFICMTYGKYRGVPFTRKSRFYDVLEKRNDSWKGIASHVMNGLPLETTSYNEIKGRSAVWNTSYNARDSVNFYTLFDSSIVIVSDGFRHVGKEQCKNICRGFYAIRPDITWFNIPTGIEVNDQWHVAYETGNWTETWTEQGDKVQSQIKGKYYLMWRYSFGDWRIISAIFTPLLCAGSYCNKSRN